MKILYIGNYKDGTGWANASLNYILAMDYVDIDIVPRCIKLNNISAELPKKIIQLEQKDTIGSDICIQAVLPHHMVYDGRYKKNIGLFFCETSHFKNSCWPSKLNLMDEIWVATTQQKQACIDSGVIKPIKIIPVPANLDKYNRPYQKLELDIPKNSFIFYHIGEMIRRKNLADLIKAFHLEFHSAEPVELLIKTHLSGLNEEQAYTNCLNMINDIKTNMKLYPNLDLYKQEIIITKRLSEIDMNRIHITGDCGVYPSYGEGWSLPAFDTMAFGKVPIYTQGIGIDNFAQNGGIAVSSRLAPVFEKREFTFTDLFCSNENWQSIDILALQKHMRRVYTDKEYYTSLQKQGIQDSFKFSYLNIGRKILHELQ